MNGIVWIASYPKSGNTWMRIFLENLLRKQNSPVDINRLSIRNFSDRMLWDPILGWETSEFKEEAIACTRLAVQETIASREKAMFKTHEAFCDMESGAPLFSAKASRCAVYIIRNPLDVVQSFANHMSRPFGAAIRKMNDKNAVMADNSKGPRPQLTQFMGDWSWHVNSWVSAKDVKVQVFRYEDLLEDPYTNFTQVCRFIGLDESETNIRNAVECSKFEVLKEQEEKNGFRERTKDCPRFFNKGQSGRWRETLTQEQVGAIIRVHGETMKRFGYFPGSD